MFCSQHAFLPLSLLTRRTIYFRARLLSLCSPAKAQEICRAPACSGRPPLPPDGSAPRCGGAWEGINAWKSLQPCRKSGPRGSEAQERGKPNTFPICRHRHFCHGNRSGCSFGLWGWAFFLLADELCSGRNAAKYGRGLACTMLLIAAPVDGSACSGKRQRRVPVSAQATLSPSGEHRPWPGH